MVDDWVPGWGSFGTGEDPNNVDIITLIPILRSFHMIHIVVQAFPKSLLICLRLSRYPVRIRPLR